MAQNERDLVRDAADPSDEQIVREGRAAGSSHVSANTGTGSAGSGLAAGGPGDATTAGATDRSEDLADAAGPSGARFGGSGDAGGGLGGAAETGTGSTGAADEDAGRGGSGAGGGGK